MWGIGRPPCGRRGGHRVAALLALALVASACGGDDEPELTVQERLSAIEGRELTQAEVDEHLATGAMLCRMDDDILDAVWFRLDDDQLDFQDFVFSEICPDRSTFYAGQTGRIVTEDAEKSGLITSTTRPTITAPASASTTTRLPTIIPAPSDSGSVTTSAPPGATSQTVATTRSTTGGIGPSSTAIGEGG